MGKCKEVPSMTDGEENVKKFDKVVVFKSPHPKAKNPLRKDSTSRELDSSGNSSPNISSSDSSDVDVDVSMFTHFTNPVLNLNKYPQEILLLIH